MILPLGLVAAVTSGALLASCSPALEARQSATIKDPVGAWEFQGCYEDNIVNRVLPDRYRVPFLNSAEGCTTLCHDKGYEYAGLEYAIECWCGHEPAYLTLRPSSECNLPCIADPTELCGAANRMVLYRDTDPLPDPPTPVITQSVGTWSYKACYQDSATRLLAFRFSIPEGNNAERCTERCEAEGYGLAGLEYGVECWCDNYMPYGTQMPDADCNFACPGDNLQMCGAGNRLQVYVNSAATPPSTSTCITWRDQYTFGNNVLYAVPRNALTPRTKLFNIPTNPPTDPEWYSIIATCTGGCPYTDYYNYPLIDGALLSYNSRPLVPVIGSAQTFFFTSPQNTVSYNQFCAKPNPASPDGPFIGFPRLSIHGSTTKWSLCPNITDGGRQDLVYDPVPNHPHYDDEECEEVYVEITPYA
ncbi:hypothetical protein CVT24_012243 [Panaeolus cyanescens]|uniref:WSC domain-containing protein n=1 Tax=Panaeolus cyanescens TaxID=181874 RepID=A0A409W5Q9_9AGAR|nr:hypothetical protein CVT24_012243 [Panaeolus cyanescens]